MGLRRIFLGSMIVSFAAAALLGIVALLLPRYGPSEEVLVSAALFAGFSLLALFCTIVLEKRRRWELSWWLMWVGIGSSAAALVTWMILNWFDRNLDSRTEETVDRVGSTFMVVAIVLAQSGLLSLPRFDRRSADRVRGSTVVVSVAMAATGICLIWWYDFIERFIDDDLIVRGMGVLLILAICGTVITPILWKVEAVKRADTSESIPGKLQVAITCPRCRMQQVLRTGPSACSECGLRITIGVQEPRCKCGYLLYQLTGDQCPECGRVIPETDRWAASSEELTAEGRGGAGTADVGASPSEPRRPGLRFAQPQPPRDF